MGKTQPKTRSKKAWRKVDTADVEEFEEAKRNDKSAAVASLPSDDLFFVDTAGNLGGQKDKKRKKAAGVPDSADEQGQEKKLKPSTSKKATKKSKKGTPAQDEKEDSEMGAADGKQQAGDQKQQDDTAKGPLSTNAGTVRLREKRAKKAKAKANHEKSIKASEERKQERIKALKAAQQPDAPEVLHDLWGDDSKKPREKDLKIKEKRESLVKKIGIKPVHPGASFNPDEEARQALVQKAYERDLAERKAHAELLKKVKGEFYEINTNLFPEGPEPEPHVSQPVVEKRLTRQQRNKQKRHRIREKILAVKREEKQAIKDGARIPQMLKELKKEDAERERRKAEVEEKKKANPREPKLGKITYEESFPEVVLKEEVKDGSLLNVPASKQVVADQFERFQAKRLIEPRKRIGKTRKSHPVRWANKHSLADDIA